MLFYENLNDYVMGERRKIEALEGANIPERAIIRGVFSGQQKGVKNYTVTAAADSLEVDALGVLGDRHRGVSHASTGRETSLYHKKTIIRQHRHLCIVSSYDCQVLSDKIGVEITPQLLGANLLLERVDGEGFSISELPHRTRLVVIPQDVEEAPKPPLITIAHFVKQQGCGLTGEAVATHYNDKSLVKKFRENAKNNRGIICSVEYPVEHSELLRVGQQVLFKFPTGCAP